MKQEYGIIGIMSGTSIDGIDLAYCRFKFNNNQWNYSIEKADTIPYTDQWLSRLVNLSSQDAETFAKTDVYYGHLLGSVTRDFIEQNQLQGQVDLISSHGQTIFHNPQKSYTVQIGKGSSISFETGLPCVSDLRSVDVAYGGQGAPIIAIGERDLFPEYKLFMNLGGITNIQFHSNEILGYDICSANLILDRLANLLNHAFDMNGDIARSGKKNDVLLHKLNSLAYFAKKPPKSLHAEDLLRETMPIIESMEISVADSMATVVEHIAEKINQALIDLQVKDQSQILVTGGGAFNSYLMERIQAISQFKFVIPSDPDIIKFKEALVMAYMGLLRWEGIPNVLASVTGASKDTINGSVFLP